MESLPLSIELAHKPPSSTMLIKGGARQEPATRAQHSKRISSRGRPWTLLKSLRIDVVSIVRIVEQEMR